MSRLASVHHHQAVHPKSLKNLQMYKSPSGPSMLLGGFWKFLKIQHNLEENVEK